MLHFNSTAVPQYIANQHDEHKEITHTASKQQNHCPNWSKVYTKFESQNQNPKFSIDNIYPQNQILQRIQRRGGAASSRGTTSTQGDSSPSRRVISSFVAFIVAWRHCSLQLRLRRWRRINWKVEDDSWFCKVRMELREKRESQLHIVDLISQWLDFSVLGFYIYTNRSVRFFLHHLHLNLMNLLKFQLLL